LAARGQALLSQGRLGDAADAFRKACAQRPGLAAALCGLGIALARSGRPEEALKPFSAAIRAAPAMVEAHMGLGTALRQCGRPAEALPAFAAALRLRPALPEAAAQAAIVLLDQGRAMEAEPLLRQAVAGRPGDPAVHRLHGRALRLLGRIEEAAAAQRAALRLKPDYAAAQADLGDTLKAQGALNEAIAAYERAIALDPRFAAAYRVLAHSRTFRAADDPVLTAMRALAADPALTDAQRMNLAFALGKAWEDLGDHDRAFTHLAEGNRLKRATFDGTPEDGEAWLGPALAGAFPAARCADRAAAPETPPTPIFIVGMPRSGTSLVEQILASHPLVHGAGELPTLERLILARHPTPEAAAAASTAEMAALGAAYLEDLRHRAPAAVPYVTDKMPLNFRYLGVIARALPQARVIHCRRDALDTCLSNFKTYFSSPGLRFAYDLTDLGRYHRLYEAAMAHWRTACPDLVHDLSYEALIADQEVETRRLLDACGLPWDDACLRFHETERVVQTTSSVQVRRPLYRSSVSLAEKYGDRLAPLVAALRGDDGDGPTA
jgi:tetratricopeptide (TPR) repeat protein